MVRLKIKPGQRGLATIEMAMVVPLLFLLTFGLIEYGWLFLKAQQVTNAARQGARVGATPDATNSNVTSAVSAVMTAADMGSSGYTVNIVPGVGGLGSGTTFTVTVSVPYANITLTGIALIPTPTNLVAATSMAKEGP